jgi:hypothetical protein
MELNKVIRNRMVKSRKRVSGSIHWFYGTMLFVETVIEAVIESYVIDLHAPNTIPVKQRHGNYHTTRRSYKTLSRRR